MNATTRKATPAQNKLPVRNHTTSAMIPAGRMNRRTLAIRMIMTMPTTSSSNSSRMPYRSDMSKGNGSIAKKSPTITPQKGYLNIAENEILLAAPFFLFVEKIIFQNLGDTDVLQDAGDASEMKGRKWLN